MARSSKRKSPSTLATSKKNKTITANNTATVDCHNNNNNNENSSRKPASNFISQLQTLREFTQGCTQYNETDLSSCLRACGYNVQIAAEKLITGQYRDHNQRHHHHQDHQDQHQDQKSGKSILFQHASGSKEHTSSTTSAMKRQVSSSAKRASQTDTMTSKPIAISRSCEHHASGAIKLDTIKHDTNGIGNGNESTIRDAGLLLCQRWVCGLSTSRKGSIEYNEPISIIPSTTSMINAKGKPKPKGVNTVRFKGTKLNIEGTLDTNISSFLSPFLSSCKDTEGNVHKPMIQIMAKALMEDDRIKIGMEVPLELNVYILRPKEFFQLFQSSADGGQGAGAGAEYWSWKGKLGGISTLAKAAFDLLQWAHYSSLPTFESNCTAAVKEPGGSGDDGDGDDGDDVEKYNGETEEENAPEWANDLYSNTTRTSTKGSEQTTQQQQQQQQQQLAEEKDPVMLNKKGVHLRCYQRQALNWMIHREEHANEKNSEDFKKQLELLSELSALQRASTGDDRDHGGHDTSTNSNVSGSGSGGGTNTTDVQCAVGPVLVSNKVALQAKSLDGQEPSVHPLWQQRFLWDKDADADRNGNNVYSFYVNELLQTASKCSPNAPRECRGGILADAMGLGKTVMLLALIANDVERREDVSKQSPSDVGTGTDTSSHTEIIEIESDEVSDGDDEWKPVSSTRSVSGKSNRGPITTLVVAPLSLLVQWEEEIQSKSSLSCLAYYGDQAKKLGESDLTGVDVLITTYGTLQSEYSSKLSAIGSSASTPLLSTCFRRVILDEAHIIKNPNTGASKACCEINAERRWCVTGTPISNSLQDIFGLIKFLKHEPWCVKAFWKKAIQTPKAIAKDQEGKKGRENKDAIDAEDIGAQSLERVRRVLQPLLLRRTKDTLAQDGTPILTLPPIETKIISVILSEEERHFYNVLLSKSQTVFEGFIQAGTASKSWFAIFALLQRLRQSCDHLALTVKARLDKELKKNPKAFCNGALEEEEDNSNQDEENDKFLKELLNAANKRSIINNRDDDGDDDDDYRGSQLYTQNVVQSLTQCIQNSETYSDECAICLEVPSTSDLAVTPCSHIFCRSCLRDSLDRKKRVSHSNNGECPICAEEVADDDIICTQADAAPRDASSVRRFEQSASKENELNARDILESALKGKSSSKILAIVRELESIWDEDPGTKVLIFSQYLGMFDLLQREFTKRRMTFLRLDGKMSLNDRRRTVKQFNSSSVTTLDENGKERGLVLLASMKACGVGLNLTASSSVFIVDPWWNHALESQCINRIHRIGQTAAKVRVRKFIVTDSVEEKIVKMQERKQGMASEVLSDKASAGKTGKPTLDDFKTIFGRSE